MIDKDMKALPNLDPSFAVAGLVTEKTFDAVLCGVHMFAYQLSWQHQKGPTALDKVSTLVSSIPLPKSHIGLPKPVPDLETKINALEVDLIRIYQEASRTKFKSNLTSQELRGLRKLKDTRKTLRITVCDKTVHS
ncbi:hypothetical protein Y032_0342g3026 [Ancylostoma ceylanicum]|uniref:Uncharacterized protein n=1 Tax=Ancylostoma ceylanicum TaxID=53326 RepID=A0A016RYG6_9BILA|nr:hypothetical protein Y032_0342g3026 [Ancylostoma ceylanicum]